MYFIRISRLALLGLFIISVPCISFGQENEDLLKDYQLSIDNLILSRFDKILNKNVNDLDVRIKHSLALTKLHKFDQALLDINYVLMQEPNDPRLYEIRSYIYTQSGDYYKALDDVNRAIKINPLNHHLYFLRGIINYHIGNFSTSMDDTQIAFKHYPENSEILAFLVLNYLVMRDYDNCKKYLKKLESFKNEKYQKFIFNVHDFLNNISKPQGTNVTAKIIRYGIYKIKNMGHGFDTLQTATGKEWENARGDFIKTTDQIPMQIGMVFGMDVMFYNPSDDQFLKVDLALINPPMHKEDGGMTSGLSESRQITCYNHECTDSTQFVFSDDYEMVPGKWVMQYSYKGKMLLYREFYISS